MAIEEPEEIPEVPPSTGVSEAMPVNHDTASAVSPEADGSYADEQRGVIGAMDRS